MVNNRNGDNPFFILFSESINRPRERPFTFFHITYQRQLDPNCVKALASVNQATDEPAS